MYMDYENEPVENIGDWYTLFKGDNTAVEEPKETKPVVSNALSELIVYSTQAAAYANFISANVGSIKRDIEADIAADAVSEPAPPEAMGIAPQPLALAVANRHKLVEYSEKLAAVIKSIDSILARVKFKEQQ